MNDDRLKQLANLDMSKVERHETGLPASATYNLAEALMTADAKIDFLSEWELDFVYDLGVRARQKALITLKQLNKLEEIYEKHLGRLPPDYKRP
jgi:hypothetical protein